MTVPPIEIMLFRADGALWQGSNGRAAGQFDGVRGREHVFSAKFTSKEQDVAPRWVRLCLWGAPVWTTATNLTGPVKTGDVINVLVPIRMTQRGETELSPWYRDKRRSV